MQAMNKIQHQQQPTSQKLQVDGDVMKKLNQELEIGKNSIHVIRSLILQNYPNIKLEDYTCKSKNDDDDHQDYYKELKHHSMVALNTYLNSISMLKSVETRKLDHLGHFEVVSPNNSCNSGVSANHESNNMSLVDHGRERYKKRKVSGELIKEKEVTHLTYDGFGCRKYGQKFILNHHYPRQYFRCTHKPEQNCQATKQIQQISENPMKYKLINHGNHTCNNNVLKTSPYIIDDDSPKQHSSSAIVWNLDESIQANPLLIPTSSYKDNLPISDDPMGTTNVTVPSNHVPENYTSIGSPPYLAEEFFNNMVAGFSNLSDIFLSQACSGPSITHMGI